MDIPVHKGTDVPAQEGTPITKAQTKTPVEKPVVSFPFLDLPAQFDVIRDEVMAVVQRVLESQRFILGDEVEMFEQRVAPLTGCQFAVGCASGSDALLLALMELGVGPQDEIITTPFTFFATAGAIARLGARPVFVDIDAETFNIDPGRVEAVISPRTRAILPVHLFGLAAEMKDLLEVAARHELPIIEDAAQAIGARYAGKPVGGFGTFGCFSFFPSKNLGGAGDGGLITTNDPLRASRLRMLRAHGSNRKYHYDLLGINSRLDALQAAILRVKLNYLEKWAFERRLCADRYRSLFSEFQLEERVKLPRCPETHVHVYNQYVVRCPGRDRLQAFLREGGIPTEVYYPLPLHLQPAFDYLGWRPGALPESEAASREVLALPIYPELTFDHQVAVVKAIHEFYATEHR